MAAIRSDVRRALRSLPMLGAYGFDAAWVPLKAEQLQEADAVRRWLTEFPLRAEETVRRGDSKYLHDFIEQDTGTSLSHGAVILGAALSGFHVIRFGANALFPFRIRPSVNTAAR